MPDNPAPEKLAIHMLQCRDHDWISGELHVGQSGQVVKRVVHLMPRRGGATPTPNCALLTCLVGPDAQGRLPRHHRMGGFCTMRGPTA